ncbi:ATP-dependent DNA helicase RecG [candidate division KSB1 bacterium]|nr:ATP-dependent DNA helicase RecG [candidate division KSB1 bacterium]NIR72805.1 ATP-dependent DNA helicase RecG [candidate division KSB1 bacterium]NIS26845.1 ATP-dependent DNA helicase RecG [candidate division KSB1 bacterium]NIT73641.1 ATP-dependent DNA helicase RecG [candidate division KSB1 bacterium]NIU27512.1 ATP-dependent DNA helicase RecG [candidate division KSB1 bacterium]
MFDANPNSLSTSVQFIKGIGEKRAKCLHEVDVKTVLDLLYYFPRRYLDRSHITKIKDLKENDVSTVVGKVQFCGIQPGRRKRRFVLVINDGTGLMSCVWFSRVQFWDRIFEKGETIAFGGKVGRYGRDYQMVHPEYDKLSEEGENDFLHTGRIIPLYPSNEALGKVGLDSRGFRRVLRGALKNYAHLLQETLPKYILDRQELISLRKAIENVHFPRSKNLLMAARKRLKFDELFYLELMLAYRKKNYAIKRKGIEFLKVGDRTRELIDSLPFELTDAQKKVIREIRDDMKKETPMNRLLQGDVGSGKTLVALISMMMSIENGYQAAIMAPTEILAEQHYLTLKKFVSDLGIKVVLLIGSQKKPERREILAMVKAGKADLVVGTHALIQEGVEFHKLGLVIVDEQHRFGVLQRASLIEKGLTPDVLVMTATPIPRTLSLTLYGDLDVSILDEMPPGRKPVKTYWRSDKKRPEIYEYVKNKIEDGAQVYIIFPLVEESEKVDLNAAIESYESLNEGIFAKYNVGLLHGRMKSEEKERAMTDFKSGQMQVLVSTTVIEVGVDVPNATIMIIENAERFGLPQLHQLRGRVGRGTQESYCFLIAKFPISRDARARLDTISKTNDGFKIAEVDLKLRGPGEFFGTKQHGLPKLRIADIVKDTELLLRTRQEAFQLAQEDKQILNWENMSIRAHFFKNYRDKFELAQVG